MKKLQLFEMTLEEVEDRFSVLFLKHFQELKKEFKPDQPEEYLSRKEVADMLKIELSTLHNWVKKGKLQSYGIGNRVYFLRSDIEKAMKPLNHE
ncbi:helix-turn-helix domain-containing protein [Echinicola marina]|uniref:helix-turn-helix domain-containing protein n=1 Tax=Echinicola marina TaxID=2859768 RepID=UPI001CF65CC8|nr:helix-turn-helix domain-containing protein [Echinicola marina]